MKTFALLPLFFYAHIFAFARGPFFFIPRAFFWLCEKATASFGYPVPYMALSAFTPSTEINLKQYDTGTVAFEYLKIVPYGTNKTKK
jgi:hypothetical protein